MKHHLLGWGLWLAVCAGCSCEHGVGVDAGKGDSGEDAGPRVGQLVILPATASLAVTSGTPASVQLHAAVATPTGNQPVSANWSSDQSQIATVDPSGLVTASGPWGGRVTISANAFGQTATAQVQVSVTQTVSTGADGGVFSSPPITNSPGSPSYIYPYDQVVIPVNLQPLNFQWKPGVGNDLFAVILSGPGGTLIGYIAPADPTKPSWQPDPEVWVPFAQSNLGQKVTLNLLGTTSSVRGPVYGAPQQTLTFAASRFAGTIYYWTVSGPGQVLRLSAGSTKPVSFYTPPPQGTTNNQCMGCHSINRQGTRLSAELWNSSQTKAGTALDLTADPVTAVVAANSWTWRFSTFDGTGKFLVTSWNGALTLRDADTGWPFPSSTSEGNLGSIGCAAPSTCTHPSWSADSSLLFFSKGTAGHFSYDVDFDQADLVSVPWDKNAQAFGSPTTVVAYNYDGAALANFHPTVSIDNQWVAFNRGPCSRSDGSAKGCPTACDGGTCVPASLMLVGAKGGTPTELAYAESPDNRNWFPNFSPFKEGGYHWLAFFSERDYGWVTTGKNRRQLWVTAIDDAVSSGRDPSHPAFWLPGQDTTTENDKAEWAPLPCVGKGKGCQGDIDCCSGLVCRQPSDGGGSVCVDAASACGYVGSTCFSSADCCAPLSCIGGMCGVQIQ